MSNWLTILNNINSSETIPNIIIRTIIIYIYAISLIRGNKRFRLDTPFDYILLIIIGAVLGRTIYGGSSLVSSLVASFILIFLHKIFAICAFYSKRVGTLLKGKNVQLIDNYEINWVAMKKNQITKEDLENELRFQLHIIALSNIKEAFLERTGKISFIF